MIIHVKMIENNSFLLDIEMEKNLNYLRNCISNKKQTWQPNDFHIIQAGRIYPEELDFKTCIKNLSYDKNNNRTEIWILLKSIGTKGMIRFSLKYIGFKLTSECFICVPVHYTFKKLKEKIYFQYRKEMEKLLNTGHHLNNICSVQMKIISNGKVMTNHSLVGEQTHFKNDKNNILTIVSHKSERIDLNLYILFPGRDRYFYYTKMSSISTVENLKNNIKNAKIMTLYMNNIKSNKDIILFEAKNRKLMNNYSLLNEYSLGDGIHLNGYILAIPVYLNRHKNINMIYDIDRQMKNYRNYINMGIKYIRNNKKMISQTEILFPKNQIMMIINYINSLDSDKFVKNKVESIIDTKRFRNEIGSSFSGFRKGFFNSKTSPNIIESRKEENITKELFLHENILNYSTNHHNKRRPRTDSLNNTLDTLSNEEKKVKLSDPKEIIEHIKCNESDSKYKCNNDRCCLCKKKLTLSQTIIGKCRCNKCYCPSHLGFHKCTFDFKIVEQEKLRKINPEIIASKMEKI